MLFTSSLAHSPFSSSFFFFNDTATTEIYTLSLHDALPISGDAAHPAAHVRDAPARGWRRPSRRPGNARSRGPGHHAAVHARRPRLPADRAQDVRSEEHTSELQSRLHLVCRLLLEKKKQKKINIQRENNQP